MQKAYRFKCRFTTGAETVDGYHLVFGENEQHARAEFYETHKASAKLPGSPTMEILAVDEIDDASITESLEGADLRTIPALQRLPHNSLLITPDDNPGCEWGWVRKVWRDAEGHDLADKLKVVGCYAENPPWYLVSSSDGKLRVFLCQEHLAENFPNASAVVKKRSRVSRYGKVIHESQRNRTK